MEVTDIFGFRFPSFRSLTTQRDELTGNGENGDIPMTEANR
jgi:hypothetical protein